jgi:hypothetical protein
MKRPGLAVSDTAKIVSGSDPITRTPAIPFAPHCSPNMPAGPGTPPMNSTRSLFSYRLRETIQENTLLSISAIGIVNTGRTIRWSA